MKTRRSGERKTSEIVPPFELDGKRFTKGPIKTQVGRLVLHNAFAPVLKALHTQGREHGFDLALCREKPAVVYVGKDHFYNRAHFMHPKFSDITNNQRLVELVRRFDRAQPDDKRAVVPGAQGPLPVLEIKTESEGDDHRLNVYASVLLDAALQRERQVTFGVLNTVANVHSEATKPSTNVLLGTVASERPLDSTQIYNAWALAQAAMPTTVMLGSFDAFKSQTLFIAPNPE